MNDNENDGFYLHTPYPVCVFGVNLVDDCIMEGFVEIFRADFTAVIYGDQREHSCEKLFI
jgi:hypothetical protein